MKKILSLLALLLVVTFNSGAFLTLPRPIQVPAEGLPSPQKVEVGQRLKIGAAAPTSLAPKNLADDDALLYAFRIYAGSGYLHGWYNFPASEPYNIELIKDFGEEAGDYGIVSATYANGKTFAYVVTHWGSAGTGWNEIHMPIGIAVMDHTTGEFEVKFSTETWHAMQYNQVFYDMTYDPVTDEVYACEFAYGPDGEFTNFMNIYTIDQETCKPTFIGQLDCVIITLAADNGKLYGITQNYDEESGYAVTSLVSFDPTAADEDYIFTSEKVVDVFNGSTINYSVQTMEFDLTTHKLYWLGFKNSQGFVTELDIETGRFKGEQSIPYSAQYLSLTIPYQTAPDAAPAQVRELTVTPAENGGKEATITWKNPSTTYQLEDLTELTGVKIYRNDELINTVATTEIGGEMTYTDTNIPSGTHTYKLVPYNAEGDGLYREYTAFIGEDVPGAVVGLMITTNGDEATLTWNAPSAGINGGWYDASTLKYNVWRGSTKVASNITETTITDKVAFYAAHEYSVEAFTAAGDGESAIVKATFGPTVELPYTNELETKEKAEEIIILDGNGDGVTWYYSDGYQGYVYIASMDYKASDYLVLPPMNLQSGKKYQIRFYYYASNYSDVQEELELVVGKGMAKEDLATVVDTFQIEAGAMGAQWFETYTEFKSREDGVHNFAFKCVSEPQMGFLILSHFTVREMSDIEAAAIGISGPADAYLGSESEYTVTVKNLGSKPISSAVVKLLDFADGINTVVLAQTTIESLAVSETRDVKISWIPTEQRGYKIYGSISTEGDSYSWDNVTDQYLTVQTNSAEDDRWLTIGENRLDFLDDRVIDMDRKYSRSQWMFYPDELGSDLTITGMRLHYSASDESVFDAEYMTEVPVIIRMTNTDNPGILDSWFGYSEYDFMEASELTTVFEGTVDISGTDSDTNILEIKFDQPFEYSAQHNLLVDIDKGWEEAFGDVLWHLDSNPKYEGIETGWYDADNDMIYWGRGGYYNWSVPYEEYPYNTDVEYFPYIKFSYSTPGAVEGIASDSNVKVQITDNAIILSEQCDLVEIYGIAGMKLVSVKDTNSISTENFPAGIYVIKAVSNGNAITTKAVIK